MGFGSRAHKRIACNAFSRVGACGRRPSESADPVGPASWVLYRKNYRVRSRKKLYRGRGLGLASGPKGANFAFRKWWGYEGKMKDLSGGTIPGPGGSPTGSRGGFWRSSGELLGPPEWSKSDEN